MKMSALGATGTSKFLQDMEMIAEKQKKYARCMSCGDLMQEQKTHCKQCLGYGFAWIHIQRARRCLEAAR